MNTDNENDPIEKAIAKYKNHPSLISVKNFMENSDSSFSFEHVPKDKITKTIKMLDPKKVVQSNDILTKLMKSFNVFVSDYIYINLNKCIKDGEYVEDFKKANVHPCTKKMLGKKKVTTDLLLFFQMFQKFTKGVYMIRSMIFFKINFLDINADFTRVSIPKMHFFPWYKRYY